jgi:uncharacterized protein YdeI (YjbR/CyaY-like superfamily)
MEPKFFASPAEFRDWLERNHTSEQELLVGYHKKGTGRPSLTWSESVDEALCFGWIDGIRRTIDAERYTIRFTPRRKGSVWSKVNIRKVEELIQSGRMRPAGERAFEKRAEERSGIYSFEQRSEAVLSEEALARIRADAEAWKFWESQPPGYRRQATWWVVSAKREDTRSRRLEQLIADSAAGQRIAPLRRP